MTNHLYTAIQFLKSSAKVNQAPADEGYEVAFAGRSNAGKSSALNCLTNNKQLAKTSKTPGRTQLINFFTLDDMRRVVDLPGYGYAKVSQKMKESWQKHLAHYLESRACLKGLVVVMDSRHPLKPLDKELVDWCLDRELPVHLLLTKTDKLSKSDVNSNIQHVKSAYALMAPLVSVQGFSALKKEGLDQLRAKLDDWFDLK